MSDCTKLCDKGTHAKDTGHHAQKDEYKAMLNDSSISDLYQHFLEPVAFVQVPRLKKSSLPKTQSSHFWGTEFPPNRLGRKTTCKHDNWGSWILFDHPDYPGIQTIVKAQAENLLTWRDLGFSRLSNQVKVCHEFCRVLEVDTKSLQKRWSVKKSWQLNATPDLDIFKIL